jgi:cell division septation protein DedD
MNKKIKAVESNSKPENKKVDKVVENKSNAQTTPAAPVKAQNILHRQGQLQLMQKNTKNREYFIQLKSVRDKMLAKEACQNYKKLLGDGFECHLDLFSKNKNELFWRVQWGPFSSHQKALETLGQVKNKWKVVDAFIVNSSN